MGRIGKKKRSIKQMEVMKKALQTIIENRKLRKLEKASKESSKADRNTKTTPTSISNFKEEETSFHEEEECDNDDIKVDVEMEVKEENGEESHFDMNEDYEEEKDHKSLLEDDFDRGTSLTLSFSANKKSTRPTVKRSKAVFKETGSIGGEKQGSYQSCDCIFCFKILKPSGTCLPAPTGVDADLMVMFVLKKLLEIPRNNLEEYLQLGDHPRDWIFFCGDCKPVVLEAFSIQTRIQELETRLKSVQENMRRRISSSFSTGDDRSSTVVTTQVRKYVVDKSRTGGNKGRINLSSSALGSLSCNFKESNRREDSLPPVLVVPPMPFTQNPSSAGCSKRSLAKKMAVTTRQCYTASEDPLSMEPQSDWREMPDLPTPIEDNFPKSYYDENSDDDNPSCPENLLLQNGSSVKEDVEEDVEDDVEEDVEEEEEESVESEECQVATETAFRRCALCPKIEPMDSHAFARHVLYHYDRPYKCLECGSFLTGNPKELDKYPKGVRRSREANPNHTCSLDMVTKVEYKVEKIWECIFCEAKYERMEERDLHENSTHHQDTLSVKLKYKCALCIKEFRSKAEWRVHRALNHPEIAKFSCDYCDETFKLTSNEGIEVLGHKKLKTHMKTSHNLRSQYIFASECDFCGANFKRAVLLQRHTDREHAMDSSLVCLYSCAICHARFTSRYGQQQHLCRVHLGMRKKKMKSWICDVCGYATYSIPLLHEHQLIKHGRVAEKARPVLKCSAQDCAYQCFLRRNLEFHMMKEHGSERQNKCDICGKTFLKTYQLRTHQQIHENATLKPFQCEICGNSFAVKNYLYIHMRLSHQNRPFASTHKKKPARRRRQPVTQTALLLQDRLSPPESTTLDPQTQV